MYIESCEHEANLPCCMVVFFCTLKSCMPVSSLDCSGQAASQSFFVKSSVQYSIDYADSFTAARDIHERIYCKCNGFGYKQCVLASCKACNNYYMVLETAEKSIIVTERLADGSLFFGCFPFHLMFWVISKFTLLVVCEPPGVSEQPFLNKQKRYKTYLMHPDAIWQI